MRNFFIFLVYLGVEKTDVSLEGRSAKLCNQINVYIGLIMLLTLVFLRVMGALENSNMGMGSLRVFLVFLISILCLFFAALHYHWLSKILTIFLPSFFFIVFPTLFGFVEAESFTYYAFVIIGFSLVPQLLLIPDREKWFYRFTILYFFVFMFFIDRVLILFMKDAFPIVDQINSFYPYYKVGQIGVFVFIHLSVLYLRQLNTYFENDLQKTNICLQDTALELSKKNKDLYRSQKVLEDKNTELLEYQEKIKAKNNELQSAFVQLKGAQHSMVQSEKMAALGTLIAGIAHEINNPLNYITGGVGIVDLELERLYSTQSSRLSDEQVADLVETVKNASSMINAGVNKASEIVDALKVYTYKGETKLVGADLNKILESSLSFLKSKLDTSIKLEKTYYLDQSVPLHQGKIHQIFLNLFDNAIHAVKESVLDRFIYVTTSIEIRNEIEYAKVSIVNTGPQIPDDILKNIFDPFYTTKTTGVGTGLGLSITLELVKEHKGELKILNMPNGVGYILLLPMFE